MGEKLEFETVAVVGAGTMGHGIAAEFARAGALVRVYDEDARTMNSVSERVRAAYGALVDAGLMTAAEEKAAASRVDVAGSLEAACDDVSLVVEAVSEDLSLKQALYRELDALTPGGAILASNTSGLSITAIASATPSPECVAGLHFWNPAHVVPLVEVTRGEATSERTAERLMDACRALGKKPILVRHDVPGFVGNRLQYAVLREALHLVGEGVASVEDIDTAMTAGPGLRWSFIGPLRTADLGGLDVFYAISTYLFEDLSRATGGAPALKALVDAGALGLKSGKGFYDYEGSEGASIARERDRVLLGIQKLMAGGGA